MSSVRQIKDSNNLGYGILTDCIRCLRNGTIISTVIGLLAFCITLLVSSFSVFKGLEGTRSTLLIVGSFGILIGCLLILKKKSEKDFENIEEWKENYKILSYRKVFIITSITVLLCGCIVDYVLVVLSK